MGRFHFNYETDIGRITISENDGFINGVYFAGREPGFSGEGAESPLTALAAKQIGEYLAGKRKAFDLPVRLDGDCTAFQRAVWGYLLSIPYGQTRTYAQAAGAAGNAKAARAAGAACGGNPISIVVPCHRIVGANGKLTGFGGGLEVKRRLLELERGNSAG